MSRCADLEFRVKNKENKDKEKNEDNEDNEDNEKDKGDKKTKKTKTAKTTKTTLREEQEEQREQRKSNAVPERRADDRIDAVRGELGGGELGQLALNDRCVPWPVGFALLATRNPKLAHTSWQVDSKSICQLIYNTQAGMLIWGSRGAHWPVGGRVFIEPV